MSSGFMVMIEDVDVYPNTDGESIFVGPGQSVDIALRKEVHKTLPKPYSEEDCVDGEQDFNSSDVLGYPYSQKACASACYNSRYKEVCDCYIQSRNRDLECTYTHLINCPDLYTFDVREECLNNCKRTCNFVKYIPTISKSAYPNPVAVEAARRLNFPAQNESAIRRRLLELSLHFATLDETRVTQHPRYEPFEIFSNFGGMLGLCLGVSLISLLELCEFLLRLLLICCKRQQVGTGK